jgi:hypothetical protein
LLSLSSDFQAEEELLDQAHVFKVFLVTGMSFRHPWIFSGYEIYIVLGCMGLCFPWDWKLYKLMVLSGMVVVWFLLRWWLKSQFHLSFWVLEAMKALCHPYLFWLKGFFWSRLTSCLHILFFVSLYPVIFLLWGCWVWTTLCHYVSFHLGFGSFILLMFAQWVMMAIFPRGFLKVDFYFSAQFYLSMVNWLIGKTTRVIPCVFSVLLQEQNEALLLCS